MGLHRHLESPIILAMIWHLPGWSILIYPWTAEVIICLHSITCVFWKAFLRTDFFGNEHAKGLTWKVLMPNVCHSLSASSSFLAWLSAILAPEMQQTMSLDAEGMTVSCCYLPSNYHMVYNSALHLLVDGRIITMTIIAFNNVYYLYGLFHSHISVSLNKLIQADLRQPLKFSYLFRVGGYYI